jgi:hypothetical protein
MRGRRGSLSCQTTSSTGTASHQTSPVLIRRGTHEPAVAPSDGDSDFGCEGDNGEHPAFRSRANSPALVKRSKHRPPTTQQTSLPSAADDTSGKLQHWKSTIRPSRSSDVAIRSPVLHRSMQQTHEQWFAGLGPALSPTGQPGPSLCENGDEVSLVTERRFPRSDNPYRVRDTSQGQSRRNSLNQASCVLLTGPSLSCVQLGRVSPGLAAQAEGDADRVRSWGRGTANRSRSR